MSQPGSLSNLDAATDRETDCTFKCVSSAVNPKTSASCCSEKAQKRLDSSWTVCQLWKLWPSPAGADVATKSTKIVAWPRLCHAEMKANPQAFKISQVAQEQDYAQESLRGGAQSLESKPVGEKWEVCGQGPPSPQVITSDLKEPSSYSNWYAFFGQNPLKLPCDLFKIDLALYQCLQQR